MSNNPFKHLTKVRSQHTARFKLNLHSHLQGIRNLYAHAFGCYNASKWHKFQAMKWHRQAMGIDQILYAEQVEADHLHQESAMGEEMAMEDAERSKEYVQQELFDAFVEENDLFLGHVLYNRSQSEMEEAQVLLNKSEQEEANATQKIQVAQDKLIHIKALQENRLDLDSGFCKYAEWICRRVRQHPELDRYEASNKLVVQASLELQKAIQEHHQAQQEHEQGLNFYFEAIRDGNTSLELLRESGLLERDIQFRAQKAEEYQQKSEQELEQANREEAMAEAVDKAVVRMQSKSLYFHALAKESMSKSIAEAKRMEEYETLFYQEQVEIETIQKELDSTMLCGLESVAGANWYALKSFMIGFILLLYILLRLWKRFKEEQPLKWIIRDHPFTGRDTSYLFNHVLHFILSVAFIGEILTDFGIQGIPGKMEILFLFSLNSAFLQATLLHLVPHLLHIWLGLTDIHVPTLRKLLWEDVVKRGALFFGLFLMEILICVCCFGKYAFDYAYKLNGWCLWILVFVAFLAHILFFGKLTIYYDDVYENNDQNADQTIPLRSVSESSTYTDQPEDQDTPSEMSSFVSAATTSEATNKSAISSVTRDSSGLLTVHLGRSSLTKEGSLSSSQQRNQYGSMEPHLRQDRHLPTDPVVVSTFVTSMQFEHTKLTFLFDVLLICWSFWIIRTSIYLIHKLSKIPQELVWAKLPGWILSLFLWTAVGLAFWECRRNPPSQAVRELFPEKERVWNCNV